MQPKCPVPRIHTQPKQRSSKPLVLPAGPPPFSSVKQKPILQASTFLSSAAPPFYRPTSIPIQLKHPMPQGPRFTAVQRQSHVLPPPSPPAVYLPSQSGMQQKRIAPRPLGTPPVYRSVIQAKTIPKSPLIYYRLGEQEPVLTLSTAYRPQTVQARAINNAPYVYQPSVDAKLQSTQTWPLFQYSSRNLVQRMRKAEKKVDRREERDKAKEQKKLAQQANRERARANRERTPESFGGPVEETEEEKAWGEWKAWREWPDLIDLINEQGYGSRVSGQDLYVWQKGSGSEETNHLHLIARGDEILVIFTYLREKEHKGGHTDVHQYTLLGEGSDYETALNGVRGEARGFLQVLVDLATALSDEAQHRVR